MQELWTAVLNPLQIISENGKRYKWPAVNVSTVKRFGRSYYLINTSDYKKLAKESERRNQDRVKIGLRCVLSIYGDDGMYYGIIKDISQGGVAFIPEMVIAYEGKLIELQFADSVRGHEFQIRFKIRVVRKDMEDGKILYGCRIVEAQRDALAYLYKKLLIQEAKNKAGRNNNGQYGDARRTCKPAANKDKFTFI